MQNIDLNKKLYCGTNKIKMENNGLKKSVLKIVRAIKFDNTLMGEKSFEDILIYDVSYKTLIGAKPLRIKFDKIVGFSRVYD